MGVYMEMEGPISRDGVHKRKSVPLRAFRGGKVHRGSGPRAKAGDDNLDPPCFPQQRAPLTAIVQELDALVKIAGFHQGDPCLLRRSQ